MVEALKFLINLVIILVSILVFGITLGVFEKYWSQVQRYTKLVTPEGKKITIPQEFREDMARVRELVERKQRKPQAIVPLLQAYAQILGRLPPNKYPAFYAFLQLNIGDVYRDLPTGDRTANLREAIDSYQKALRIWTRKASPRNHIVLQNNLGVAYLNLPIGDRAANLKQAIAYFQEASRFRVSSHWFALAQNNLGDAYLHLTTGDRTTNLKQAIECFQTASRMWSPKGLYPWTRQHMIYNHWYALAQNNLGSAYLHLPIGDRVANLNEAITCFSHALSFWRPMAYPLFYAMVQHDLGTAYSAVYLSLPTESRNSYLKKAIDSYQEALRFRTPEMAPLQCIETNRHLADLYFTQGEWQAAIDAYVAAIKAGELLYRAGLSSESKMAEAAVTVGIYRRAAFAAARCRKTTQALLILEQGKTRLLAETLHLHVPRPENVPNEVWVAYERAGALVRAALFENGSAGILGEGENLEETHEEHKRAVTNARAALDSAIERIRRYYDKGFLQPMDLPKIQKQLPDERTVFIAFCITEIESLSLVVHKSEEVQVVEVPNFTQAQLRSLLSDWLKDYTFYRSDRSTAALNTWQVTITKVLVVLGKHLLDPILSSLPPEIERIIFLPSAELFLFPLHAVPLPGKASVRVCDRYQVSYAPSIEVLANVRTQAVKATVPDLYAVINPQADPQLFFTSIAGAGIARHFPKSDIDEGRAGTKQNVIARARGRAFVLFSCHGGYDWENPTESGLVLADGRLTLADLQSGAANLSNTRLVTLAACEVGITDVLKGSAEEYVGVPAGFMLAGVPCIISSLWAVWDISTALLIEQFFANHLQGELNYMEAMRKAQVWVRDLKVGQVAAYAEQCYRLSPQKDKTTLFRLWRHYIYLAKQDPSLRPFEHPYYWAAFTVNGSLDLHNSTSTMVVDKKDQALLIGHLLPDARSRGVESSYEQAGQSMPVPFSPLGTISSPKNARKGNSFSKIAGPLLVSLVLLVLWGILGWVIVAVGTERLIYVLDPPIAAQVTATAQASAAQAIATARANTAAAATAKVVADNPDPYPPTNGRLALYDPLTQPSNWINESNSNYGGTCQFIDDSYSISETKPDNIFACYPKNSDFRDFAFEVQIKIIKGDCGGMVFRASQSGLYAFIICQDGAYDFHIFTSSNQKDLRNTQVSGMHTGLNQSNTIAIVADGSNIDIYVNNQRIDSIQDTTSDHGGIALLAGDFSSPTKVIYNYAKVWAL